ncbi:S24 family peptidase [Asticcacaulis endophyticus]|nr:helix-turn-helix transcriptional regulator [Asticcacaulis endophyticus]
MDDTTFTSRQLNFIEWMSLNGLTFVGVSDASGIPYSSLKSFAKNPGQSMNDRNIQKLVSAFGVSADDIFKDPQPIKSASSWYDPDTEDAKPDMGDILNLPEYELKISAGGGYTIDRERIKGHWPFSRHYIRDELRLEPRNLSVIEVKGDSMEPLLRPGDRVVVDHNDKNAAEGGLYVIWNGGATVVKRVEAVPYSDPPMLVLISENKTHNQYPVHAELVNVVGRVVWVARRM